MKVVLAGGSGFIGSNLATHFTDKNDEVVVLTRGKSRKENGIEFIHWDAKHFDDWCSSLESCDVLINLTGKSVDCRYTEENKAGIINSRVDATNVLGAFLALMDNPPKVWINLSTATIYRHSEDKIMDEINGEVGNDFSMNVAQKWEEALNKPKLTDTRRIALRVSLVIGKGGGVYPVLKRLAKFGLAGTMGNGKQRFAWIHISDCIRLIEFIIENENMKGPVNCTGPSNPTNKEFMNTLRTSLGIPIGLPQPAFLIKFGAWLMRTESELILKSRWVTPKKLLDEGFKFEFETAKVALDNLAKD